MTNHLSREGSEGSSPSRWPQKLVLFRYPAFGIVISLITGFLLQDSARFPLSWILISGIIGFLLLMLRLSSSRIVLVVGMLLWLSIGCLIHVLAYEVPAETLRINEGRVVDLRGILHRDGNRWLLLDIAGMVPYSPTLVLKGKGIGNPAGAYTPVEVTGTYRPFYTCSDPGVPDLARFWNHRRVFGELQITAIRSLPENSPWFRFLNRVEVMRDRYFRTWERYLGNEYPLFAAMLWGEKSDEFQKQVDPFQETGIYHAFCVSGQHLTILGAMLWFAFRRLRLSKRGITVITILFSLAYLVFCSLSPSAFRAFLMFSFYLTGKQLGRNTLGIHFLLTTFLTMFLLQPEILFDVGAELSFLSTAALLVFTEYTPPASSFFHQAKRYVTAGLFLSLTVSVFNLPILVGNGLSFSSLLFVSNLTILPLTGLSIMMNFIAAFFSWIPAFQRLLAFPVQWLLRIIAVLSDWHVRFIPHFYWHFDIRERCGDGILLWLGLIFFLFLVLFWKKTKILLSIGLGLVSLVFLTLGIAQAPGLSLWVLDVGQGMAVCSVTGYTASVIDTGGIIRTYGNTGQSVVKPFLTYQGVSAIDFIGLTHLHQDHVAGTDSLLQGFPVKVLYSPGTYQTESGGKSLPLSDPLTLPGSEGTRWEAFPVLGHSENDQAVAYRFSGPFLSLFIPGDMEEEGIRQLLEERGAMLHSDVLVMPHHGKYLAILPSLLTRIGCTTAIISCGENTYGHPDARTLALLKSRGIPFFITREKGAVGFLWKENRWEVKQNGKDHF